MSKVTDAEGAPSSRSLGLCASLTPTSSSTWGDVAQRIMAHMNNDHEDSLGHYLVHFGRIPSRLAHSHPQITTFTTPLMKIAYGPAGKRKEWTYEFSPPMHAGEARKRLEAMHQEAKVALGISDVTIDRVILPIGAYGGALLCTALTAAILYASPSRLSSTLKYQSHILFAPIVRALGLKDSPRNIGRAIQGFWLVALYGAHLAEALYCLPPHLKAYNVKNKAVRMTYFILTILGGFPVWIGLRDAGKAEERKLKAQ
ncbi:hypothetical protein JCM10021v2_000618 [Rhodotorula toruloides]|uniref:FGENESH: predicted gene_8.73 protein n=1 Tax=Rhodotorula toruloides TaxID=5286 RepID=A0A0K3CIA7_RHOTO